MELHLDYSAMLYWYRRDVISGQGHPQYGKYVYTHTLDLLAEIGYADREEYVFFDGDCASNRAIQIPYNREDQEENAYLQSVAQEGFDKFYAVAIYGPASVLEELHRMILGRNVIGYAGKSSMAGASLEEFHAITAQAALDLSIYLHGGNLQKVRFGYLSDAELRSLGYQPEAYSEPGSPESIPTVPSRPMDVAPFQISKAKYPAPDQAARDYEFSQNFLGKTLLGRYEVFQVKRGGMAFVLCVEDKYSKQEYAIKTIHVSEDRSGIAQDRLRQEIEFWIRLPKHPNIVQAHSVEVQPPYLYLIMEYVEGENLREWIGRLSFEQTINFAYQICLGMAAANKNQQVVHGDLKPENILISRNGIVKITDFGLSQSFGAIGEYPRIAGGSYPYMSPEQLRGQVADERSDIFSFGIVLYEMLTGKLPYMFPVDELGKDPEKWRRKLEEFYNLPGLRFYEDSWQSELWTRDPLLADSRDLEALVVSCLFTYRDHRWTSFRDLAAGIVLGYSHILNEYKLDISKNMDMAQRAAALLKIGKFSEALELYNAALRTNPDNTDLWLGAAEALAQLEMIPSAREFVARAQVIDPKLTIRSAILNRILARS